MVDVAIDKTEERFVRERRLCECGRCDGTGKVAIPRQGKWFDVGCTTCDETGYIWETVGPIGEDEIVVDRARFERLRLFAIEVCNRGDAPGDAAPLEHGDLDPLP